MTQDIIDASIIIRTYNEQKYLGELLSGIEAQDYQGMHETIIVDSGSTDSTLDIAGTYKTKVLHMKKEDFSFGRSLNVGCNEASGKYLVFISGHCIPTDKFWLTNLLRPLVDNRVSYVYGRQVGISSSSWSECRIFNKYYPDTSSIPQDGFYCNNANSALLQSVWHSHQFNELLTGLEDMELAKRISNLGYKIGYQAQSVVYHIHSERPRQIKLRFEREALALRSICPEIRLDLLSTVRYLIASIVNDLRSLPRANVKPYQLLDIFRYRYCQYLGSFRGSHAKTNLSRKLRDSYFYPSAKKGLPLTHGTQPKKP